MSLAPEGMHPQFIGYRSRGFVCALKHISAADRKGSRGVRSGDVQKRLNLQQIEAIARRLKADEPVSARELSVVCETALDQLRAVPSQEMVRLAQLLVSSRGALPLQPAQAVALGTAVLQAARPSLLVIAGGALRDVHAALELGRNWIEGLARIPVGSKVGPRLPGLARSMAKTMQRHLVAAAETLGFGMAAQQEPLDPSHAGFQEVPGCGLIAPRQCANALERAHESLRLGRLGLLKIARFAYALSGFPETRTWDEALAQQAARSALDAGAHMAEAMRFLSAEDSLP